MKNPILDFLVVGCLMVALLVILAMAASNQNIINSRCSQFANAKLADTPASCIGYFSNN